MPRKPLPRMPKGQRWPGSDRKKGTPNKITMEARALAQQLVECEEYQYRLRRDFTHRKGHPRIESMIWAYYLGKPAQPVAVAGTVDVTVRARLAEETAALALLDLADLEALALESQAAIDRAMAKARAAAADPS